MGDEKTQDSACEQSIMDRQPRATRREGMWKLRAACKAQPCSACTSMLATLLMVLRCCDHCKHCVVGHLLS